MEGIDASQVVRLLVTLALVVGIMLAAVKIARRRRGLSPRTMLGQSQIELVARRGLSRSSSIAVVKFGDRNLVVGVTDAAVSVLADIDDAALGGPRRVSGELEATRTSPSRGVRPVPARMALLDAMRERTVRRV
jgi:flagellar protein FliO/FliZ